MQSAISRHTEPSVTGYESIFCSLYETVGSALSAGWACYALPDGPSWPSCVVVLGAVLSLGLAIRANRLTVSLDE
jgi:hypothetical protein